MALGQLRQRISDRLAQREAEQPGARANTDAPVAGYADIVRAGGLWVALEGDRAGAGLALRMVESGEVVPLPAERRAVGDQAASYVDLAAVGALPDDRDWTADLVVTGGGAPEQVWIAPSPADAPTVPVPASGSRRRFRVRRGPAGFVKIHHRRAPAEVEVLGFRGAGHVIEILLPAGSAGEVVLVADGEVRAAYPVVTDEAGTRAVLTADRLPAGEWTADVLLATERGRTPLARRANGVVEPAAAVVLPPLFDEGSDDPRMRLRFSRAGLLVAGVEA